MRSSGRAIAATIILLACLPWVLGDGAAPAAAGAQEPAPPRPRPIPIPQPGGGARAEYEGLTAREQQLRRDLDLAPQLRARPPGDASASLLERLRDLAEAYEALAGRQPRSGYGDRALWQAAALLADGYWQFGDARDRAGALRLFGLLRERYPASPLASRIDGHTARLGSGTTAAPAAVLSAIRHERLGDTVRVTLELEAEALFADERLDGPPRVFLDLRNTSTVDALRDAVVPLAGDLVRQARIGQQPDNRTRVVFDLADAARYSVYSLYNPHRIVIDFERGAAPRPRATAEGTPRPAPAARPAPTPTPPTPPPTAPPAAPTAPAAPAGAAAAPAPATPASPPKARGGVTLSRQLGLGVSRIVIDPGHGGHDPGARVRGLQEAELVLDIALRLEQLLARDPDVTVVLTRRANTYVALEERTDIANRSSADLFLSIHANASANGSVRGFETYVLDFAANAEAEALAARENAGSSRTMGSLPDLVKAIALNDKIDESRNFASALQGSMRERLQRVDRRTRSLGVKQAPFMVLVGATMPSALVEVSFLTNAQDAVLLKSTAYRQEIAEALLAGIARYQQSLKGGTRLATE